MPKDANVSPPEDFHIRPLSGRRAFTQVLENGARRSRGPITVVAKPNSGSDSGVGLVVSRAVGGAVARNRARRRIRAALKGRVPAGYDLVVIARKEILEMAFQNLEDILGETLSFSTRSSR